MISKDFTISAEGLIETKDDTVLLKEPFINIGAKIARELDSFENKNVKITVTVKVETK